MSDTNIGLSLLSSSLLGRYDEAFRLADFCVSDLPPTPEERQLGTSKKRRGFNRFILGVNRLFRT